MRRFQILLTALTLAVFFLSTAGCTDGSCEPQETFDAALAEAAENDALVLIDFYAEWCGPCKQFAKELEEDDDFRTSVQKAAVFLTLDAERGEGEELAERYGVNGYPTYVIINSDAETVDRWAGYGTADAFLAKLQEAVADPATIDEKQARFEAMPNAIDAKKLGDLYSDRPEDALRMYRRALELDPDMESELAPQIFHTLAGGYYADTFQLDEVVAGADAVLALDADENTMTLVQVAFEMDRVSEKAGRPELFSRYLDAALLATEGTQDPGEVKARRTLLLEKALKVDRDLDTAVNLKRDTMPDGWKESADLLNSFAWWCFENKVNLEEAEELARTGVTLAEPGTEKAMILDTLAEICNERGEHDEAIQVIQNAHDEDPENDYYIKQLERFRGIVKERNAA